MQTDDEAVVRYRKKRKKKQPKKADHKHEYVDCVFDFNPETIRYIIGNKESSIGSYCPTCGKIKRIFRKIHHSSPPDGQKMRTGNSIPKRERSRHSY